MKLTFTGVDDAKKTFRQLPNRARAALGEQLYREAETIMTASKRLAPVDEGIMRASGVVDKPVTRGTTVTVLLGYGGVAKPYALIQHERLDFHHRVGEAKFLERPVNEAASGVIRRLDIEKNLA